MRQIQKKRLAYYEPAIHWCHANANYSAFVTVVLQPVPGAVRALLAMESTCQEILEPRLNSPWVHTLLRKVGIHLTKPQHPMHGSLQASGRRLVCIYDRCCYNFDHALGLGFVLSNAELAFQLLYKLVDGGIGKFHASRVLRATYATAPVLYLLWRLTVPLQEPFRMRSRNQLKSVFKFRKLLLPPLHCRIRSLQLSHDFVQALRKWVRDFVKRHRSLFPPLNYPSGAVVDIANPALSIQVFNYKRWLQKWHPMVQWRCACRYLSCSPTKSGHCFARATDATALKVAQRNLSDTTWPPPSMFFITMEKSFTQWCKLWGLPGQVQDEFNIFLTQ